MLRKNWGKKMAEVLVPKEKRVRRSAPRTGRGRNPARPADSEFACEYAPAIAAGQRECVREVVARVRLSARWRSTRLTPRGLPRHRKQIGDEDVRATP